MILNKIKSIYYSIKEIGHLEKKMLPVAFMLSSTTTIFPFINIWFTSKIVDLLYQKADKSQLLLYICAAITLDSILFFLNTYLAYIYENCRSVMHQREKKKIATKLYSTEYTRLNDSRFKELIHKYTEGQKRIFSPFVELAWMLRDFISGLLTIAISVILVWPLIKIGFSTTGNSFFETPSFLITILVSMVIMTVIIIVISLKMNKNYFKSSVEYSNLDRLFYYFLSMFSDYKSGKEIRLYKEQHLIEHIATSKLFTTGEKILKDASLKTAKSSSLVAILGAIVGFGIYLFIGVKGLYGLFSIGSLVLYCGAFMQIINGITRMVITFGKTEEMIPMANYYFEIMNTKDEMTYGDKELDGNHFEVEFKNVSFRYPGAENDSLKNINLKINKGEHLAIVGKNGSGKTTFILLLCRFYDVTEGEILINNVNIKEYTKETLMSLYSVVFQDFKIFSTTVADNISKACDDTKLYKALNEANIQDRILRMKHKENTYLYKDLDKEGVEISGGEAQKLALARALYKDSSIVILDEPTAALDPIAENEMYTHFNSFVKDKTAIYISHRLSSCAFCDKIAVFDKSRLVESGTHKELLSADGRYAELWNAQAKYYARSEIYGL